MQARNIKKKKKKIKKRMSTKKTMYFCLCLREKEREGEITFIYVLFCLATGLPFRKKKLWWCLNLRIWMRSYSSGFIVVAFFFSFSFFKIKKRFGKKKNNNEIRVRKLEILLKIKRDKRNR